MDYFCHLAVANSAQLLVQSLTSAARRCIDSMRLYTRLSVWPVTTPSVTSERRSERPTKITASGVCETYGRTQNDVTI